LESKCIVAIHSSNHAIAQVKVKRGRVSVGVADVKGSPTFLTGAGVGVSPIRGARHDWSTYVPSETSEVLFFADLDLGCLYSSNPHGVCDQERVFFSDLAFKGNVSPCIMFHLGCPDVGHDKVGEAVVSEMRYVPTKDRTFTLQPPLPKDIILATIRRQPALVEAAEIMIRTRIASEETLTVMASSDPRQLLTSEAREITESVKKLRRRVSGALLYLTHGKALLTFGAEVRLPEHDLRGVALWPSSTEGEESYEVLLAGKLNPRENLVEKIPKEKLEVIEVPRKVFNFDKFMTAECLKVINALALNGGEPPMISMDLVDDLLRLYKPLIGKKPQEKTKKGKGESMSKPKKSPPHPPPGVEEMTEELISSILDEVTGMKAVKKSEEEFIEKLEPGQRPQLSLQEVSATVARTVVLQFSALKCVQAIVESDSADKFLRAPTWRTEESDESVIQVMKDIAGGLFSAATRSCGRAKDVPFDEIERALDALVGHVLVANDDGASKRTEEARPRPPSELRVSLREMGFDDEHISAAIYASNVSEEDSSASINRCATWMIEHPRGPQDPTSFFTRATSELPRALVERRGRITSTTWSGPQSMDSFNRDVWGFRPLATSQVTARRRRGRDREPEASPQGAGEPRRRDISPWSSLVQLQRMILPMAHSASGSARRTVDDVQPATSKPKTKTLYVKAPDLIWYRPSVGVTQTNGE